jgi:hypothetical protein
MQYPTTIAWRYRTIFAGMTFFLCVASFPHAMRGVDYTQPCSVCSYGIDPACETSCVQSSGTFMGLSYNSVRWSGLNVLHCVSDPVHGCIQRYPMENSECGRYYYFSDTGCLSPIGYQGVRYNQPCIGSTSSDCPSL